MDPLALATAATALLAPFLVRMGEKAADSVGAKLPEMAGKLWNSIAARFKGKPAAEEAARDLVAQPDDADNQAAFRKELKKALEADEGFAAEVSHLLQSAQGDAITNTGKGAIATQGAVAAGAGGVAVKGNVSGGINVNPSGKQS